MDKQRLEKLYKAFSETYKQLYESHTPATDIIESHFAQCHDNDMKHDPEYKKAVLELAKYREDIFSSDRECAAVYIAVCILEREDFYSKLATA